ncbi:hypothetical protein [Oceanivirga miroungae]|uniref:Uncharacterized protein n=1 Tax=Oceanivirga miroungae TaxID=1130046 RepID=A0A6I8M8Y4_9FUSO|nr:hypothetical protein [Oceanivirga miroungae]VWL85275.1 hypothetical protein OMES3154_00558 [Oceanivirga miroungae]
MSELYVENIGFCKKDSIDMIEENKNVFSIGAGSITKLIKKILKSKIKEDEVYMSANKITIIH